METPAISLTNVSMMFNLNRDKVFGFKEYVVKALKRELYFDEFWALKDITFDIRKGEILGVLGHNGSGKSTLLKLIAGVFKPTHGTVTVNGSIAPLLELSAGFDYEFSAKENVYMNGAMFGHSPAYMENLYEGIMDFADLWDFENVPLKNFSSGMAARLGFAVATQVNPEILIIDEILGVGDYRFVEKCKNRVYELCSSGATVLIVSHSKIMIEELCQRALILQDGKMICIGNVEQVCQTYYQ